MKGKLSLLSAAVIMALAGTSADAAQKGTPAKSSGVVKQNRTHFNHPRGGDSVLYDQTLSGSPVGFISQNFTDFSSGAYNAVAADDFVVTDASGWTVDQVNIGGVYFNGSGPADSFDVSIYPDAGGVPGATAACTYTGLSYTGAPPSFSIPLSTPCDLPSGTYWVAAAANMAFGAGGEFGWNTYSGFNLGANAQWQNPGGGFGTGCSSWSDMATCLAFPGYTATSFQVVGHVSTGGGGGISLTVGMAEDNGNPTQCGTATTLSATAGDQINFCYTVTNNSATALNFQTLTSDVDGVIFQNQPVTIAPGATYQYNRIVTATADESPTFTWTAADALPGYASSAGSASFVDISGSGTPLGLGDDTSADVTMPFSFNFYGVTSNTLCINNNGHMLFDTTSSCSGNWTEGTLPSPLFSTPAMFPFWDDLYTGGNVYTATLGTAPNRQFVVEWFNKDTFDAQGTNPGYTFEAILNEADNSIDFVYSTITGINPTHDGGASATVGLQYDTTLANQFSNDSAVLSNGQDIHWTMTSPVSYSASQQVTLDVGAPVLTLSPTSLTGTAAPGASTSTTLTIGNTGDRDLTWNLTEAPANAHFPAAPVFTVPFHAPSETSRFRDPARAHGAGKPHAPHARVPLGTGGVPAYGEAFTSSGFPYVSFDATDPGTLNTITSESQYFFAGMFADNDFSTEYAVEYPSGTLYAIDTATGATQSIGNTGLGGNVTGIRWDSTTGTSYAMAYDSGSGQSCLYTMDLTSGATQQVGCQSGTLIIDIAIDPSGLMYGVDIIADTLVAIDKTSGAEATIGSIGFDANFAQGMDFDPSTGTLYLAGYDRNAGGGIYTVDLQSGAATLLNQFPGGAEIDAFAIAVASGPCATPADVPWLSESPTSGTTAPGGSTPVTVTMDATSLAAGTYEANVCVNTNDTTQRHVAVPVTFTVTGGGNDIIFQDGFDGTP
jgi:hypothetical protein